MRALAIALSLAALPSLVRAEDEILKGAIVKVEHQEIYVNLGSSRDVADGATLRIKRTIELRHPVTRALVRDWIPIGSATITQVGASLSRAVIGELVTEVKAGDVVEILVDRPDKPAPKPVPVVTPTPQPQPQPKPAGPPPVDPATADVIAAFVGQANQSIDVRIATWERYLSTYPASPYAEAIRTDLGALVALRDQLRTPTASDDDTVAVNLEHVPRSRIVANTALPVVFVVGAPDQVASAYLHYRPRDSRTYRRILLVREHDIYLRGAVPADAVTAQGVDYFVEVSTPSGRSGLALASPQAPIHVDVVAAPLADKFDPGVGPGRTTVRLSTEILDFATFDKREGTRRDSMYAAALDFGYLLDVDGVQRIGVGYGVVGGMGGSENVDWSAMTIPRSGFHYGRADADFGAEQLAVGLSLMPGVTKNGFSMGFEARGRGGPAAGTNVSALGRYIPEAGWLAEARLGTQPFDAVLFGISIGATNQPVEDDLAAKLGVDLEWIRFEHISLLVRASWQGRSTRHGGIGGGAALGFAW